MPPWELEKLIAKKKAETLKALEAAEDESRSTSR